MEEISPLSYQCGLLGLIRFVKAFNLEKAMVGGESLTLRNLSLRLRRE
jgi:hypothetical protein